MLTRLVLSRAGSYLYNLIRIPTQNLSFYFLLGPDQRFFLFPLHTRLVSFIAILTGPTLSRTGKSKPDRVPIY